MTAAEFKTARETLLAGIPKSEQRRIFGLLLGYSGNKPNQAIAEKERGVRAVSGSDEACIRLLRLLKQRDGHLLAALEVLPEIEVELKAEIKKPA